MANAVKGFKKSGVFPWDPTIINNKKLAPSTMFENQSELPAFNSSINGGGPETHKKPKEDGRRKNVTEIVVEVHAEEPKTKKLTGMASTIQPNGLLKEVIIDGVCYAITLLNEPKEASVPTTSVTVPLSSAKRSEILDEVLTTPMGKKKKTLGIRLSMIPRYISSKEFQNIMREKEEAKWKEEEEKKDHKQMRQVKAKEKKHQQQAKREKRELTKVKKAKLAVIEALAPPRPKRNVK